MTLDPLAEDDGLVGVGMVAVGECEMVDPNVGACDDADAVVFRVPVPECSIGRVPFGEQVDRGVNLEIPRQKKSIVS